MAIECFQAPDFSLRQLQYAAAVAQTGSFGRAAELCGVSQPSLSAQVAKLEGVLGARLFERAAQGITLTPEGQRLMPVLQEALTAAAAVEVAAATLKAPYALPVRIAIIPTVAPYLLPSAVQALVARPGLRVHWLELQTADAEEAVATGRADAMLIADPPRPSGVVDRILGWEPFLAAVPADSVCPRPVPVEWLGSHPVLLLEEGHCLREHTVSLCRLSQESESPFRATSLATLMQMVSAGLGVTVVPAMALPLECSRARVEARPFDRDDIGRTLRLAWRGSHQRASVLEDLAGLLEGAVAEVVTSEEPACGARQPGA